MKAFTLAAVLVAVVLLGVMIAMPPPYVCTPNAQNQLVCLGR
jgi:hypothetical protein